jgi:prepilin peptidase CpaA
MMFQYIKPLIILLAGIVFLAVGCVDIRKKHIPNLFSYGLLVTGLLFAQLQGVLFGAIIGMAVCGGFFLLAWLARGAGGGDVKLMAAAGAWAGWPQALDVLVYVSVLGAVWAGILWLWGRLRGGKGLRGRIPYGLPIGVGTAMVLWFMRQ